MLSTKLTVRCRTAETAFRSIPDILSKPSAWACLTKTKKTSQRQRPLHNSLKADHDHVSESPDGNLAVALWADQYRNFCHCSSVIPLTLLSVVLQIKFFERRKLERRLAVLQRQTASAADGEPSVDQDRADLAKALRQAQEDLQVQSKRAACITAASDGRSSTFNLIFCIEESVAQL